MTVTDAVAADLHRLITRMPDPAGGEHVWALERELATRFGVRHTVAVASGTAALHTALKVLAVGPGDEVLVPALSVIMSVAPVVYVGARPVFVDCNPHGNDFDYDDLTAKTTDATTAVLAVNLWGRAGDPGRLARWADERSLKVIEDACQAQGSQVDAAPVGTHGTIGCFSMKDGKVLWCGEGGYLFTDDDELAAAARSLRSHGQPPLPARYPPQVGHNYRLAEPLAVIASANLARFDDLLTHRQHQATLLRELIQGTPGLDIPEPPPGLRWNGYSFLATVSLPNPRAFCEHVAQLGVPNSIGTFRLVPTDQRPEFTHHTSPQPAGVRCRNAATVIDRMLAVVLTDHDDDERITRHAQTIVREANQWHPHT
jgi:dTDP-4-amino-4,6-dideoxygalactose transaminase